MNSSVGKLRGAFGGIEQRRQDLSRVDDFLIKNTAVSGRILVVGAGETVVEVAFPVWFIERPNFTYGGELEEGQSIEAENFPTISGIVETWTMKKAERLGGGYYVGARVICVTTGKENQNIYLHWRCEGKAITNPALSEDF